MIKGLKYCKKCILPNTRPNNPFNEHGICSACLTLEDKKSIDWGKREEKFKSIVKNVKKLKCKYDCIIPVSGGKDSTWQVIKALEYNLNPLCVTWKTPSRNKLGTDNLNNLISLGVNHIDFTINPKVEKIFTLKSFRKYGSTVIPMHMALHAIPLQMAVAHKIPLIIWGENSAYEYGGEDETLKGFKLTRNWLKKYSVTHQTTANDWIDKELSKSDLSPYFWPSDLDQEKAGVSAIFLGQFFKWDPIKTYQISKQHGFKARSSPKTGYYEFADIDDEFLITIHHWLKWHKFGFTRLWDNLSIEIRNNRISRSEAIGILKEIGEEYPSEEINSFCDYVSISKKDFFKIVDSFRNINIWGKDANKEWKLIGYLLD